MRNKSLLCLFWSAVSVGLASAPALARNVNVRDEGAKGDGVTVDTASIQRAIDACAKAGGGTVIFPAGQFVSGTILLKDNVTLQLDEDATLLGSTNIADYQAPDKFLSGNGAEMGYCFIGAVDVKNVGIKGAGLIDGRGKELLEARPRGVSARPFLARFVRSEGISVAGVRMQGSAAWTVHFSQCRNILAERLTINSRGLSNNDGIDVDSSQDVRIKDCDIDTGDDAICLKTTSTMPTRNVEVSGCKLRSHWAGIKFGTESIANFENIRMTDCHIRDTRGGIKLFSVDGANMRNVYFSNLTMENVNMPIFIRLGARLKTFRVGDKPQPVGTISNLVIKDIRAQAVSPLGIVLSGIPGHAIRDVTMENIEIKLPGGGTREAAAVVLPEQEASYPEITMFGRQFPAYGMFARHVNGLTVKNVTLELAAPDFRPAIICDDAARLELSGWKLPATSGEQPLLRFQDVRETVIAGFEPAGELDLFLSVTGNSKNIKINKSRLEKVRNKVALNPEVSPQEVRVE